MEKYKMRAMIISSLGIMLLVVGVSYSFFNYTRTGVANNLGTGTIYFDSEQGLALNITNVFPMKSSEAANAQLDSVTVEIEGNTTYSNGEEFEVSLVGLNNTINGKEIPINYIATYEATEGDSIGTSSDTYWESRESKNANIYKLNSTGQAVDGKQVLVGYIKNGETGIHGTLTIKAYIDADRIAISDTYYENATATPTPTVPNDEYGTTTEWVDGRVVLTTTEWNSLSVNGISFQIRTESNEGIWASPQIESCIGCKYLYTANVYQYSGQNRSTINDLNANNEQLFDDYRALNKSHFLGLKFENGILTNAYACGIKGTDRNLKSWIETTPGVNQGTPFCIEGSTDGSTYEKNSMLLGTIWNDLNFEDSCDIQINSNSIAWTDCFGSIEGAASQRGFVYIDDSATTNECYVHYDGTVSCDYN